MSLSLLLSWYVIRGAGVLRGRTWLTFSLSCRVGRVKQLTALRERNIVMY
jgi:hypothetical protein